MKRMKQKIFSFLLIVLLFTGLIPPGISPSFAAPVTIVPTFTYEPDSDLWNISWPNINGTQDVYFSWHDPDGTAHVNEDMDFEVSANRAIIEMAFAPDHIYDLSIHAENNAATVIGQVNTYFLADITFENTSFNEITQANGIEDANYLMLPEGSPNPTRIISGANPTIKLRWKVPTMWHSATNSIRYITLPGSPVSVLGANVNYAVFQIEVKNISNNSSAINYTTTKPDAIDGEFLIEDGSREVSGSDNLVINNGYVEFTLTQQEDGILPGTEYENTIKVLFKNPTGIYVPSTLKSGRNGFLLRNKDDIFANMEGAVTSVYTPVKFELSKVDIDKLEVRIYGINNTIYSQLFYQVQDAGSPIDLLQDPNLNTGPKLSDVSIDEELGWGSVIMDIPLRPDGSHPERYYRVVVTDGDSIKPLSSMAIDLRLLGTDTGKPPVPREIRVEPIYTGKGDVTTYNSQTTEIPKTDLILSFEKPLTWRSIPNWDVYKQQDYDDSDFIFHVLLNTRLSDDTAITEKEIGTNPVEIYVPNNEKRVLVIGKKDLNQDPTDNNRLWCTIDGDKLFWDKTEDVTIETHANGTAWENDEDADQDGNKGDYPTFLVPNTTYYLRIFSSRYSIKDDIDWSADDHSSFEEDTSYISPFTSFTTYPLHDLPVPLPNLELDSLVTENEATGQTVLNGISVSFNKILRDTDWSKYTGIITGRRIEYDLYVSDKADENSFIKYITLNSTYPSANSEERISNTLPQYPGGIPIKSNTTYYFKASARLFVDNQEIGQSNLTVVKSITTPKIDSGSIDDLDRAPRTPVEFSISKDSEGELEVSDAKAAFNWLHAESGVTYEIVCTTNKLDPNAVLSDYINDVNNVRFLQAYRSFLAHPADHELNINVLSTPFSNIGFTYDEDDTRIARFPVNIPFLRPNHLYYFSIRAVRNRGQADATFSNWVSIPVTTKMVDPPGFLEVIRDVQLGFMVTATGAGITADDFDIYIKKESQPESSYQKLAKSRFSIVKDGYDYYCRLFGLDPDTRYDIKLYNKDYAYRTWYNNNTRNWGAAPGVPIQMKTRDTLHEIEVRFEGALLYQYFLEILTDDDEDYMQLEYFQTGETDIGYKLNNSSRTDFYREKTKAFVEENSTEKYIYYAKISMMRTSKADGTLVRKPLKANTRYSIKAWARNIEDSKHIGPVTVRTDFSQEDYDSDNLQQQIVNLYETKAEGLTRKLYWTVDEANKTENRILLKGTRIANLLQTAGNSGVTIDISQEKPETATDTILIPYSILEALEDSDARLTLKLPGGEVTIDGDTLSTDSFKKMVMAGNLKETMLSMTISRKDSANTPPPEGFTYASKVIDITLKAVGCNRTYKEIDDIILNILNNPEAKGPFSYGILDREISKLISDESILTYNNHSELNDKLDSIIEKLEAELSGYLKDIIDGGRGLAALKISDKDVKELPGGIRLKLGHEAILGRMEPYALPTGQTAWTEPTGIKAWLFPYVLFTVKSPGQYVIFKLPQAEFIGVFTNPDLIRLGERYNLQKVFGTKTINPSEPLSGDKAVLLFELITGTEEDTYGLNIPGKIRYHHLEEILPARVLQPNINRKQSAALAVELYAFKQGISSTCMRPAAVHYIKNSASLTPPFYKRVLLAVDMGIVELEADRSFNGESPATIEEVMVEIVRVLELVGELN